MPAFTMPGMASGHDTNTMVKQLVELEKKPIRRWEMDNVFNAAQIEAWTELRKRTTDLQNKTRNLTTFTSPLATKKIKPSLEGVLSGEATRGAKPGKKSIEILELAARHQISGKTVDLSKEIPRGKFTIVSGKERLELEFPGGKLSDLFSLLKNAGAALVHIHLLKVNSEEGILSLTSVRSGRKSQLKFLDPDGVLQAAGLVGAYTPPPEPLVKEIVLNPSLAILYRPEAQNPLDTLADSAPKWSETGNLLEIPPSTSYVFPIEGFTPGEEDFLRFQLEGERPSRLEVGVYFIREEGEVEKFRKASLVPLESGFEWELGEFISGKRILKIAILNSSDKPLTFSRVELVSPPEWTGAEPVRVVSEAKDAVFKIDGIEIRRDRNEEINDVLESVSLNLHKTTDEPITFDIEPETDKGKELIRDFVKSYNELLRFTKDMTYVDRDGKISSNNFAEDSSQNIDKEFWKNKEKTGLLAGENSVLRLMSGLKTILSGAYPNKQEKGFKTLAEIGISTGIIGSDWEKIQAGMLQIDEELLSQALNENPEGVKELFAADLNGDAITDEGVGFRILEHLRPYNQFAGGLITGKIKFLEEKITDNKKKIKNHETHMLVYENKLKQRFLYMEQGVGKNKSIGNYLQNNLRTAQNQP